MARPRICFVGGGSYNWTPKLLIDVALTRNLSGTVVLRDVDPVALDEMQRLGRAIMAAAEADFAVEACDDLDEALAGAEFVIVTITTGGLEAMRQDLDIPLKYGIYQSLGDTVGPGGLSRALLNVPVMVEIARAMERACSDAWMLNLTNPLTVLTRAVNKVTPVKAMGLCHELMGVRAAMLRMFDASVEDFEIRVAGVNHLIWLLDLKIRGRDGFQMVREYIANGGVVTLKWTSDGYRAPFQDRWQLKLDLFERYGYLTAADDRHLAEFFPYCLTDETNAGADYGGLLTTIEHRYRMVGEARARIGDWLEGAEPLPLECSAEGSADIIAAVANGRSTRAIVNLPNRGQVDNLPREAVAETLVPQTGRRDLDRGDLDRPARRHARELRPGLGGVRRHAVHDLLPQLADLRRPGHPVDGLRVGDHRLRLRPPALRGPPLLVRADDDDADAAGPGPGDPGVHPVQQAGLGQHLLAAVAAADRRPGVLHLHDCAVHPRHPARAGRRGRDRRLQRDRHLLPDRSAADLVGPGHGRHLFVLLHLGRLPDPADLPERPEALHHLGRPADLRRPGHGDQLGRHLRDGHPGAGVPVFAVFIYFQRYLVEGISTSGLHGR